jgi:hypothetical protein
MKTADMASLGSHVVMFLFGDTRSCFTAVTKKVDLKSLQHDAFPIL